MTLPPKIRYNIGMKAICSGVDLSDAVSKVIKACAARSTNPMLECIKLEARGGVIKFTATDLELGIEKSIAAQTPIEGEAVVAGKFFADFVSKLKYEQIELSLTDNSLRVRYGDSDGKFMTAPAAEFPPIRQVDLAQNFVIAKRDFKDLINKAAFSVSADDSRPILKGVLLEIDEGTATAVALDGFRLARCVRPVKKATDKLKAIVPARCLTEIARVIDGTDEETVTVYVQKSYLMADLGRTKVTTRLIDGDFVNYRNIIPIRFETTTIVKKDEFGDALARAILLARSERNNMVKFDIRDNCLTVSSNSEVGALNEKLVVKTTGKDIAIAFNASYFAQILSSVETDTVTINFINSTSPCVVTPTSTSEDLLYLVLPVRLV